MSGYALGTGFGGCRMIYIVRNVMVIFILVAQIFSFVIAKEERTDFWKAEGTLGVVATGDELSADAGIRILKDGGNAVDAAVASLLVLTVTDTGNFCFGGEIPIIVYDANRRVVEVLSGQGAAPRLATLKYFRKKGEGSVDGPAVPGALDACLTALERYGTLTFAEVAKPALIILDQHKETWHANMAKTIRRLIEAEKGSPDDRRRGLRLVADYFYRGPIARELDTWSREHDELLRYSDLATHVTRIEDPVLISYRGYTIYKCGPWTQGPCLLQGLRLLEGFDLKALGHNSPDYIHVVIEAMKLALADRDTYYADPLFEDVPLKALLSESYANIRQPLIDINRASLVHRPGDPRAGKALLNKNQTSRGRSGQVNDTTTCLAADRWGNVVAATPSGWGGRLAGDTGIVLGTRLKSFNVWKNHPNVIEPGKRPRITLTPTLVMKDDKPVLAVSVAGGDKQDLATMNLLLNYIEFGLTPSESIVTPRFGTDHLVGSFQQPPPKLGSLYLYSAVSAQTMDVLKTRGHLIEIVDPEVLPYGRSCVLSFEPKSGLMQAAGDPTADHHARGF